MTSGRPESSSRRARAQGTDSLTLEAERALVDAARVDFDAFSELYRHYLPRIHAFAWRRTGDADAAEDICAATFEAALRGISSYRWHSRGLGPWLFRIAANETISHFRREGRPRSERGQQALARHYEGPAPDAAAEALDVDDHDDLRRALDRLNPRYQRAIALRYLADLDTAEAARAMGLTKPALAVVLSRALRALRRELASPTDADEIGGDQP